MPPSRSFLRALVASSLVLAVPATTLVSAPAQAQPLDKKQQAKQYVDQGLAAQAAGKYDEALELYRKAYELVPHPILLFNMAQATRLAGRATAARDLYLGYLDVEPQGVQANAARELIASLADDIAAEEEAERKAEAARKAAEAKRSAEAKEAAEHEREAEERRRAEAQRAEEQRAEQARRTRASRGGGGGGLRLVGMVSGGVGLVSLGAGLAFHLRARSLSDELSTMGNMYDDGKRGDGETAETLSYVGFAAGGALLVGGATMYFLGRRAGKSAERMAVIPTMSPGSVGLVVSGGLP